jgi:hypothetical protein
MFQHDTPFSSTNNTLVGLLVSSFRPYNLNLLCCSGQIGVFSLLFTTKVFLSNCYACEPSNICSQTVTTIQSGATAACDLSITVLLCWVRLLAFFQYPVNADCLCVLGRFSMEVALALEGLPSLFCSGLVHILMYGLIAPTQYSTSLSPTRSTEERSRRRSST